MHELIAALKPYESYIRIREHELMSHHTTFRIGASGFVFGLCIGRTPC